MCGLHPTLRGERKGGQIVPGNVRYVCVLSGQNSGLQKWKKEVRLGEKKKTKQVEKIYRKETAVREHCPQTCASCPSPTNEWTQLGTDIINEARWSNDFYPQGNEVAMSGDGTTVVVAKPGSPFAYVSVHRYSQKDFSWNQIGSDIAWVTDGIRTPLAFRCHRTATPLL